MDPKQTPPLGNAQTGGQEGQPVGAPTSGAAQAPVFSTGTDMSAQPAAPQKMAGDLGAENLSTGANVSRTMDSLNNTNQSATGAPIFAKHKFDKIEYATGDIIVDNNDAKPKSSFFGFSFGSSKNNGPKVKSAAEITREARREAKRLRKLNAKKSTGSMVEPASAAAQPAPAPESASAPTPAPTPASKPQTTKRTKLIVGALVAILIIAASILGVVALTSNKSSTKRPAASATITAEAAFTDYLSYLFYGDDTPSGDLLANFEKTWEAYNTGDWLYDDEGNLIENAKNPIYAEQMLDLSSMNPARATYFDELNEKWLTFLGVYNGEYQDSPRLEDVALYFNNLAGAGNLFDTDIVSIYLNNKDNITDENNPVLVEIDTRITSESEERATANYVEYLRQRAKAYVNVLAEANAKDCLGDSGIDQEKCNIEEFDSYGDYAQSLIELAYDSREDQEFNAFMMLEDLYVEIFNIDDEDEEEIDEETDEAEEDEL